MPDDNPQARLERALVEAADALAALPPREFDRMCRGEASEIVMSMQYFQAMGVPVAYPPALTLGNAIIRHLAARHPGVLGDPSAAA